MFPGWLKNLILSKSCLKLKYQSTLCRNWRKNLIQSKKALSDACELSLKQPIPVKQHVLMADASFRSAGYALMIWRLSQSKNTVKAQNVRPRGVLLENFLPVQLKMSICSKEIMAMYLAFPEIAHSLWEATKPTIVLTDDKSVTRFFPTEVIPTAFWNACDYVLQLIIKIAHLADSVNTAADFVSRLELKVTEKILQIHKDIQTTGIDVTTCSWDVAGEDLFFFTQAEWVKKTNPWKKRTISTKCETMGGKWGTSITAILCEWILNDRQKRRVVFPEWNQGKCANTSRARRQSGLEESEIENFRTATWRSAN